MKLIIPTLTLAALAALGVTGCGSSDSGANALVGAPKQQSSYDPDSLAAAGNTQHHFQDPNTGQNGISEPAVVAATNQQIGSPEVVARLHSCGKMPYASLGALLTSRGVNTQMAADGTTQTAGTIYQQGSAALGLADYAGRVPEMVIASTSAMAKQFDVFVAAATEIQANLTNSPACPGVTIADATGNFSKEGISCILGKPATDAHVTLANQLVQSAPDVNTGEQLAIATMLEAAHTCE
jgi:hypothetical protein